MVEWSNEKISEWVNSQEWYQSIKITDEITTPGNFDANRRFKLMRIGDLSGQSVLDVGCNSGQICFEMKKLGASKVIGIDINKQRLTQAKILSEIMNLEVDFKELDILECPKLGIFDFVFCIAVVTEVPDLISALLALKQVVGKTLFLELALSYIPSIPYTFLGGFKIRRSYGKCKLRRIKGNRWNLVPDMRFIKTIFGDQFKIKILGKSSRYSLLKCDKK